MANGRRLRYKDDTESDTAAKARVAEMESAGRSQDIHGGWKSTPGATRDPSGSPLGRLGGETSGTDWGNFFGGRSTYGARLGYTPSPAVSSDLARRGEAIPSTAATSQPTEPSAFLSNPAQFGGGDFGANTPEKPRRFGSADDYLQAAFSGVSNYGKANGLQLPNPPPSLLGLPETGTTFNVSPKHSVAEINTPFSYGDEIKSQFGKGSVQSPGTSNFSLRDRVRKSAFSLS